MSQASSHPRPLPGGEGVYRGWFISNLRSGEFRSDRIVDNLLKDAADSLAGRFEFDGDFFARLADNAAALCDINDGVAQFEFEDDIDLRPCAEQASIGGYKDASKAPVLDREGLPANNRNAAVTAPAGCPSAGFGRIVAGDGAQAGKKSIEHYNSPFSRTGCRREKISTHKVSHALKFFSTTIEKRLDIIRIVVLL